MGGWPKYCFSLEANNIDNEGFQWEGVVIWRIKVSYVHDDGGDVGDEDALPHMQDIVCGLHLLPES